MAVVSRRLPWWRRLLQRWWLVESPCCLFATPVITQYALECGWCGRLLNLIEWDR